MRALAFALVASIAASAHAQPAGPDAGAAAGARTVASPEQDAPAPREGEPTGNGAAAAPEPAENETVVVSGRPLSRDRTQDATEVTGAKLRDSPRATTFEALSQESAGVYVPAHGAMHGIGNGATGGIHLRGLGGSPNSQVLVVEDGVPDYQGIFGHPIPDAYAPFLIDDALVIKGGDSVLFGTNAMGGVVAIRNRWRDHEGSEVSSDSAYGSYTTLRESASLLARLGSWDLATGVESMSTAGHRMGAGGDDLVASAAARYRFDGDLKLTVREKVVHLEGSDPGPDTHPYVDHTFEAWRDGASAQLAWSRDGLRLSVTPYLNVGVHRLYDGFHSVDYVGGAIAEVETRLHPTTELLVGVAAEKVGGEVDNRITGDPTPVKGLADGALYEQLTFRPFDQLSFVAGGRELYSSRYGFVPLYKAGARLGLGEGFYVHTRLTRNF
ncbi:MAG TPA: TonB-dependent receptor, partial [Acidimicrobiales bacterium]|nr:TonB-dependent receptor [Acidimicrobiales bacterium]